MSERFACRVNGQNRTTRRTTSSRYAYESQYGLSVDVRHVGSVSMAAGEPAGRRIRQRIHFLRRAVRKYIMSALRDAKDRINGPAVADETDALCGRKASTLGRTAST